MSWRGPIHTRLNCPPYETDCIICGKGGNLVDGASYTVRPVLTRKLSERMSLREGGGGGSSLGTLSASTRSLSARSEQRAPVRWDDHGHRGRVARGRARAQRL